MNIKRLSKTLMFVSSLLIAALNPLHAAELAAGGKTPAELSAMLMEWLAARDLAPLSETGSVNCRAGQRGRTWFLAETLGEGVAVRECLIKSDRNLFFPIVNLFYFNGPGEEPLTVEQKRVVLTEAMSDTVPGAFNGRACNLELTINGMDAYDVPIVLVYSPTFEMFGDPEAVAYGYYGYIDEQLLEQLSNEGRDAVIVSFSGGICDLVTGEPVFITGAEYTLHIGSRD